VTASVSTPAIDLVGVAKSYGRTPALEDLPTFSVEPFAAPESPAPLALVQAGAVAGVVPDTWEARLLPETRFPQRVTKYAAEVEARQDAYRGYGRQLKKHFNPDRP